MQILIYLTNNARINSLTVEIHLVLKVGTELGNQIWCCARNVFRRAVAQLWFEMVGRIPVGQRRSYCSIGVASCCARWIPVGQ